MGIFGVISRKTDEGDCMMARRTFVQLVAGLGAALGLASCEKDAPQEDLVAGEDLFFVSYNRGAGMDGSSEWVSLTREKGGAVLEHGVQEAPNSPEKTSKKKLDGSAFDEFERLVSDFDLKAASEQPESEIFALDAPVASVTFAYVDEGGDMDVDAMFSVSDTQELTDAQWEGFNAVRDTLFALSDR